MEYFTKDIYVASFLDAKGQKVSRIERNGKICWFVFDDKYKCQDLVDGYYRNSIMVEAKSLVDSIRTLKDRIFAEK